LRFTKITGNNFGDSKGAGKGLGGGHMGTVASSVSFNVVLATEPPEWTNTEIKTVVPPGAVTVVIKPNFPISVWMK
jgi:hypothetical protein